MKDIIIIARHAGAIEWIHRWLSATPEGARLLDGRSPADVPVIGHVSADDVRGKVVIGILPPALAAMALSTGVIDMPLLRADQRGKELTMAEMDEAGASLAWYLTISLPAPATQKPIWLDGEWQ